MALARDEAQPPITSRPLALFDRGHCLASLPRQCGDYAPRLDRVGGIEPVLKGVAIPGRRPATSAMHAADGASGPPDALAVLERDELDRPALWTFRHAPVEGPADADVAEGYLGQLGHDAIDGDAGLGCSPGDQLVDASLDVVICGQAPAVRGYSVKYATALRLGTAETEAILRRFTRSNVQHPTYRALAELGKAIKTIFLCRYLRDEALRREINDGLNVIEHWNSANDFVFFAPRGELGSNRREDQELSMLSLHLLQNCMVFVNTLMLQQVLARPHWADRLTSRDQQAVTPLIWDHVNPYGRFELDMDSRIPVLT